MLIQTLHTKKEQRKRKDKRGKRVIRTLNITLFLIRANSKAERYFNLLKIL